MKGRRKQRQKKEGFSDFYYIEIWHTQLLRGQTWFMNHRLKA